MRNLNFKAFLWAILIASLVIWFGILAFMDEGFGFTLRALKQIPNVVTADLILWWIFRKWGWKAKIFQGWLVPFPCLQGTWEGSIKSTWVNPKTGETLPPFPVTLVICQSFTSIHCTMFSKEMRSDSYSADFLINAEKNQKQITYTYQSVPRPTVRDRSQLHHGTVLLNIISKPTRSLIGEYWSSRNTTGEISVEFKTNELLESFTGAGTKGVNGHS